MAFTRFTASSLTTGVAKYIDADAGRTPIPSVPTIGTATDGGTGSTVNVAFTPGYYAGTYYTATSSPGSITATSNTSPITVSGLTAGTAYTFTVTATNGTGTSAASAASNSVTPLAPGAFDSIATIAPANGALSVTFSSIPQTYKSLQIRFIARSTDPNTPAQEDYLRVQFNGVTSGYSDHRLWGNGSSTGASGNVSQSGILIPGNPRDTTLANTFGVGIIDIIDYASTSKNKTLRSISGVNDNSGSANFYIDLHSGALFSTTAITSITINEGPGWGFKTGTTFALYGIK